VKRGQDEAQAIQCVVSPSKAGFKAKVALKAIRGLKTTNEIATEFGVYTTRTCPATRRIGHWKKQVLESPAGWIDNIQRPRWGPHLPVMFYRREISEILGRTKGIYRLILSLTYGAGLRLS